MRVIVFVVLTSAIALANTPRQSEAASTRPWCAQYADQGHVFSCSFDSLEQCRATIGGIGGFCMENPWISAPPTAPSAAHPSKPRGQIEQH